MCVAAARSLPPLDEAPPCGSAVAQLAASPPWCGLWLEVGARGWAGASGRRSFHAEDSTYLTVAGLFGFSVSSDFDTAETFLPEFIHLV